MTMSLFPVAATLILTLSAGAAAARAEDGSIPENDVKFELPVNARSTAWGKYCEGGDYQRIADRKASGGLGLRPPFRP